MATVKPIPDEYPQVIPYLSVDGANADAFPDMGGQTPQSLGGTPVTVMVYVEDVDTVFDRAIKAGATDVLPTTC